MGYALERDKREENSMSNVASCPGQDQPRPSLNEGGIMANGYDLGERVHS